jgi:hypothetical protein
VRVEPAVWLRAALAAALLATVLASVFDLTVSEHVVDRAVAREQGARGSHALAMPEQFTRREQRGGLVLAELLYAAGSAALVAGVAILLGRTARPALRWLMLSAAAAWALVVVPALVLPPLPPGAAVAASLHARRATFVLAVAIGVAGCAVAAWAWRRTEGRPVRARVLASSATLVVSGLIVVVALPADRLAARVQPALLRDFRLASFASQALLWAGFAAGGAIVLRRRRPGVG